MTSRISDQSLMLFDLDSPNPLKYRNSSFHMTNYFYE